MPRYVLHVYSTPMKGKENEFLHWYTSTHLREILEIDGFVEARHYRPIRAEGFTAERFFGRFIVNEEGPSIILSKLGSAFEKMTMSDALDPASVRMELYEETTNALSK